jgi:hypothetical protein
MISKHVKRDAPKRKSQFMHLRVLNDASAVHAYSHNKSVLFLKEYLCLLLLSSASWGTVCTAW